MMHRFFTPHSNLRSPVVKITDPDEIHHLIHVLRLQKGDTVVIFNGRGEEGAGDIIRLEKKCIDVRINSYKKADSLKKSSVILACAIPKKAKFELIIEKCTELGVDEIVPLITQRTQVRFDNEKARRKLSRYHLVAVNAAKQCQRATIPVIHPVTPFKDFIHRIDDKCLAFIPCLGAERQGLLKALEPVGQFKTLLFMIGPEGDFTSQEVALAVEKGCVPVSLGPTVLKVDTAAIAVSALIQLVLNTG